MDATMTNRVAGHRRLHVPACAFLILFGVAKLAEFLDWSRLHRDAVAMLGLGSGTVTGLLLAGKGAELLLTALAVLGLVRRHPVWPLAALAGWTADLALLTVVAAVGGDLGRVLEHGLTFLVMAALLTVMYRSVRSERPKEAPGSAERPVEPGWLDGPPADGTRQDLRVSDADATRHDVPAPSADATRLDLPVRRPDVTRRDLPVQGRQKWPPPPKDGP